MPAREMMVNWRAFASQGRPKPFFEMSDRATHIFLHHSIRHLQPRGDRGRGNFMVSPKDENVATALRQFAQGAFISLAKIGQMASVLLLGASRQAVIGKGVDIDRPA